MTKSILDEKCECGRDVDYFKLTGKYNNEIKKQKKRDLLASYLLICVTTIVLICSILVYMIIKIDVPDIKKGIIIGILIGMVFMEFGYILDKIKNLKPYNENKERQKHKKELKFQKEMKNINVKKTYISIFGVSILILVSVLYAYVSIIQYILIDLLNFTKDSYSFWLIYIATMILFVIIFNITLRKLFKNKRR